MKKAKLGFWEIRNMSFGFPGIQFGFALQGATGFCNLLIVNPDAISYRETKVV